MQRSPDRVRVPVLLVGGWQDLFIRQTLQQYAHLRARGVDVALTVGPWTHTQLLTTGLGVCTRESLQWLDTHLGDAPGRRAGRVHVYVTGVDRARAWRRLPDWPRPPPSARCTCAPAATWARRRRA